MKVIQNFIKRFYSNKDEDDGRIYDIDTEDHSPKRKDVNENVYISNNLKGFTLL